MSQREIILANILKYPVRWEILMYLYDGKERSAYHITNNSSINLSISSVVDHLRILEETGLVKGRDTSTQKMRRRHYKITEKGKTRLHTYNNGLIQKIKNHPDLYSNMKKNLK